MAVYLDNLNANFRGMIMCHMVANSLQELHSMAGSIGVQRKWFQDLSKSMYPHYDICLSKKKLALSLGAKIADKKTIVTRAKQLREEILEENARLA